MDEVKLQKVANAYLTVAFEDYRAARILFLAKRLLVAAGLAATAIEKQLKALMCLSGDSQKIKRVGHKIEKLYDKAAQSHPSIVELVDPEFLEELQIAYSLRYMENAFEVKVGICRKRSLISLDKTFCQLNAYIQDRYFCQAHPTPLIKAIQYQEDDFREENVVLSELSERDFMASPDDCEDWILMEEEHPVTWINAKYKTRSGE